MILFAGCNYYPSGGWEDYQGTFQTIEAAVEKLKGLEPIAIYSGLGWAHIVSNSEIVKRFVVDYGHWKEI